MDIYPVDPKLEFGEPYEEYAIALIDGRTELLFGPYRSIDHAREDLAGMKSMEEYKNKKLFLVKHAVSTWTPYCDAINL